MNWNNKQVVVTGAAGFIASHLTERLVKEGARVRAFIRYTSRNDDGLLRYLPPDILSQVDIIRGDLRDSEAIRVATRGVDTIFHLGALIAIPYSYLHPREVVETNVMGTLNVLMAARDANVRRVVHTSTSEVYGTAHYVPIDEAHPLQGQSPYSASKIGADKLVESFSCSYNLPVATLRPFNTYGPRQSARAVIPTIITQALTRESVRLGSLTPSRDFTFVEDTADGFLRIAESDAAIGQEINIGSNASITIGELAHKICDLMGKMPNIECEEERLRPDKSEVKQLHASFQKARDLMGWEPRVSLDEGLQHTIAWISQNLDIYQPDRYAV